LLHFNYRKNSRQLTYSATFSMKQMIGLWRDTWWLWSAFVVLTIIFSFVVGKFFLLLLPCLPVPFVYFAYNRYDDDGNEKADLGS
jgi:hypothetical protein